MQSGERFKLGHRFHKGGQRMEPLFLVMARRKKFLKASHEKRFRVKAELYLSSWRKIVVLDHV